MTSSSNFENQSPIDVNSPPNYHGFSGALTLMTFFRVTRWRSAANAHGRGVRVPTPSAVTRRPQPQRRKNVGTIHNQGKTQVRVSHHIQLPAAVSVPTSSTEQSYIASTIAVPSFSTITKNLTRSRLSLWFSLCLSGGPGAHERTNHYQRP